MFVADLCEGLAKTMNVTVLAPGAHGAKPVERWAGYTVRRFQYAWPSRAQWLADGAILPNLKRSPWLMAQVPEFVLAELWAAWRLMRRERFDAIHAHWAVPQGFIAALLKRRFGVPIITTTHGGDIYALRSGAALRAKRFALRSSDRVTAVSASLKGEVVALGVDPRRVDVLPMGVDTSRFTPEAYSPQLRQALNPDGPVLLFVGRLVEKKGVRYAIEAMPAILASHPAARLVIVGDGPDRPMLEQLTHERRLDRSVTFAGALANAALPAYYASADLVLAPSVVAHDGDQEGAPVALAEAMASGCPVIASDVNGVEDTVLDGITGIIVPQRHANALSRAAAELLNDEGPRRDASARSLSVARERLDHKLIHDSYARLIQRIAA
jgi:glycosyltransferase involved in cell wall biosynthesis